MGPNALKRVGHYLKQYFASTGLWAEGLAQSIPATPEAVQQAIEESLQVGMGEVILWPCIPDLDQIDRAAEIVNKLPSRYAPT